MSGGWPLLAVAVLPLFLLPTRRVARILRDIRRDAMEYSADMSSVINETLTINGALLVKTFGRQAQELQEFDRGRRRRCATLAFVVPRSASSSLWA